MGANLRRHILNNLRHVSRTTSLGGLDRVPLEEMCRSTTAVESYYDRGTTTASTPQRTLRPFLGRVLLSESATEALHLLRLEGKLSVAGRNTVPIA